MNTEISSADISIIGAGMAGASLVHLLKPARDAGLKVALIERQSLDWQSLHEKAPPSFDGRATALSWSTRQIFEQLDLWHQLASHACPTEHIQVSSLGQFGQTHLHAEEQGTETLGYIIENRQLGRGLLAGLEHANNLTCYSEVEVDQASMNPEGCLLSFKDGRQLQTRLLIIADGGRSPLLSQLGIEQNRKSYGTTALVTQIECDQPHNNWAFERFHNKGPIAFLPLNTHDFALTWTFANEEIDQAMAASDEELIADLQDRIGFKIGKINSMGPRSSYPLALVTASEQVRRSLVLLGNSAHSLHPVAGQGFNLTLRDAAALAEHINKAALSGADVGDLVLLEAYQAQQATDQYNTIVASDLLSTLFTKEIAPLSMLTSLGLMGMASAPVARRLFTRHAMGLGHKAAKIGA